MRFQLSVVNKYLEKHFNFENDYVMSFDTTFNIVFFFASSLE